MHCPQVATYDKLAPYALEIVSVKSTVPAALDRHNCEELDWRQCNANRMMPD